MLWSSSINFSYYRLYSYTSMHLRFMWIKWKKNADGYWIKSFQYWRRKIKKRIIRCFLLFFVMCDIDWIRSHAFMHIFNTKITNIVSIRNEPNSVLSIIFWHLILIFLLFFYTANDDLKNHCILFIYVVFYFMFR